ncbi:hypothetical protein [Carboxylicivirga sp. N1Y90]|uniref:hypothetical protein n=1 Tax=Carboxylicivirga fragile TaxID=3417571 RepID=UPI003D326998|nr:DUF4190 domain-containing protein [Marinilabiliaceae bacterium N1Y90]
MEITDYPKSSNTLSIAGLALSVLAFVIALIPCFGMVAAIPAVLGLIFAIIGLAQSPRYRTPKSVAIVGIIMGSTALLIAGVWTGIISTFSNNAEYRIEQRVERIIDNIAEELQETDVHIRIEENTLSAEEIARIREEASQAGEVAERVVEQILEGINAIDIESNDKKITIRIPRTELSEEELKELQHELNELETEIRKVVKEFKITIEENTSNER